MDARIGGTPPDRLDADENVGKVVPDNLANAREVVRSHDGQALSPG